MRKVLVATLGLAMSVAAGCKQSGGGGDSMGSMKSDSGQQMAPAAPTATAPTTMPSAVMYTCTMHPEVVSATPGKCPKCGMDLVVKK